MMGTLLHVLAGLAGGVAAALQAALASLMGQRVGSLESVLIIHLGGTGLAATLVLLGGSGRLGAWRSLPWYALGAGFLGVALLSAINYAIPRLGVGITITLFVTAQLTVGAVLDHFGLLGAAVRPFDEGRAAAVVLLLAGTWLMLR